MNWLSRLNIPLRRMVTPSDAPFSSTRRQFIQGAVALVCAPAIVRYSSLMPVKAPPLILPPDYSSVMFDPTTIVTEAGNRVLVVNSAIQQAIDEARRKNWQLLMKGEHPSQVAFRKLEEERWRSVS